MLITGFQFQDCICNTISDSSDLKDKPNKDLIQYYFKQTDKFRKVNTDSTFFYANKLLASSIKSGYTFGEAYAYENMGFASMQRNSISAAMNYYTHSVDLYMQTSNKKNLIRLYKNLGNLAYVQSNYPLALDYNRKALKACEETGEIEKQPDIYNNMCVIYMQIGDFENSLKNIKRAIKLAIDIRIDTSYLFTYYSNIGLNYLKIKKIDSAEIYYTKMFQIAKNRNYGEDLALSYKSLATINLSRKDYQQALSFLMKSYELYKNPKTKVSGSRISLICGIKLNIGETYYTLNEVDKSKQYLLEAYNDAKGIGRIEIISDAALLLSKISENEMQFKTALEYYKIHTELKDSINNEKTTKLITQNEMQYSFDKIIQEKELKQKEKDLINKAEMEQQKWIRKFLLFITILLSSFLVYVYINYRNKTRINAILQSQKEQIVLKNNELISKNQEISQLAEELNSNNIQIQNQADQLIELDHLKSKFFANISHEFKTPLTLILGIIADAQAAIEEPKLKNSLISVQRNANYLLNLVNQLLDIEKIEAGKTKLYMQVFNFVPFCQNLVLLWNSFALTRNIDFTFTKSKEDIIIEADPEKIEKILTNLISNALKFTPPKGNIQITVASNDQYAIFQIRDNGKGINEEHLPHIFKRFYQVDDVMTKEQDGAGIGLSIVKEFIDLHDGKITVESKPNSGTFFSVYFPLSDKEENYILQESTKQITEIEEPQKNKLVLQKKDKNVKSILLVEDNTELRQFIISHLSKSYFMIEAENGEIGVSLALKFMPDLIISDVMMPVKDGLELCRILKNDTRTSHIPIILLTAKSIKEDIIEGFQTGTDEYLVKPFEMELLMLRIKNIIATRENLKKHFETQLWIKPDANEAQSLDDIFIQRLRDIVERKFEDYNFTAEQLASEINMSKSSLNRKLQALTDMSPAQFIRIYRIKKAAELIKLNKFTISEISYKVGYNNISHFARQFKEINGKLPSDYKRNL